jgi:two-component system sensor histidine kinase TrcS
MLGVCLVVAAVLIGVGTVSVWCLRATATGIIDAQLAGSSAAFEHSADKYLAGDAAEADQQKPLTQFVGQAPGSVIALMRDGRVIDSAMFSDGEPAVAPADVVAGIEGHQWQRQSGAAETVLLGDKGSYRMHGTARGPNDMLISGVSDAPGGRAVDSMTMTFVSLILAALVVAALGTVLMVRGALRPLARVTATAATVATLPLDRWRNTIDVRVEDADPRTEVGLVGDTLNRLLDHVERALGDLAASDERMRRFLTDASHELRTPLAAIAGYAELTRQDSAELPETTEYSLSRIESETARMTSLVDDLLMLARLDEGHDLFIESIDVNDLVCDADSDAEVSAPQHRWSVDLHGGDAWIRADRAQLHQLLGNLHRNAWVHTPPGTSVVTSVRVVDDVDGPMVELAVTDDGPGIDPDIVPVLFERFTRGDRSRSRLHDSSGLGLAIAASIAEAHHGAVLVQSSPGATEFRVRLPLATPDPDHELRGDVYSGAREGALI